MDNILRVEHSVKTLREKQDLYKLNELHSWKAFPVYDKKKKKRFIGKNNLIPHVIGTALRLLEQNVGFKLKDSEKCPENCWLGIRVYQYGNNPAQARIIC